MRSVPKPPPGELLQDATRAYVRGYRTASLCAGITQGGVHHVEALRSKGAPPAESALFALGELTPVFTGPSSRCSWTRARRGSTCPCPR